MNNNLKEQFFSLMFNASRKILEFNDFKDTAQCIFDSCKEITGATAGYIALLSNDGTEHEVVFLDPGGLSCTVDPSLPMPIRGLRKEASDTCKPIYDNSFSQSKYMMYMPDGHVKLENVLFSPLVIKEKTAGLIGLANKPGGFTDDDVKIVTVFAECISISLLNYQMLKLLKISEKKYKDIVDNALVGVYESNIKGDILYVNDTLIKIWNYPYFTKYRLQ